MRLVAHAKLENSEGPWWLIWNFVSKEYADNYVPEDQPDPEPTLPDGWQDMVSEVVTSEIKWTMSPDVPFDWANLDGSLMNNFTAGNYPDWATVVDGLENLSMTLNSADMTYTFEMPDGTTTSGTYTLDEDGIYTFSAGVPTYHIGGGDIMFSATATAVRRKTNTWLTTSCRMPVAEAVRRRLRRLP